MGWVLRTARKNVFLEDDDKMVEKEIVLSARMAYMCYRYNLDCSSCP